MLSRAHVSFFFLLILQLVFVFLVIWSDSNYIHIMSRFISFRSANRYYKYHSQDEERFVCFLLPNG